MAFSRGLGICADTTDHGNVTQFHYDFRLGGRFTKGKLAFSKFNAKPTVIDGVRFASKKESQRYVLLKYRERIGEISDLELQPKFELHVAGQLVCKYLGDFAYTQNGARVIEDVKSKATKTPLYRLKRKILMALNPTLDHREVV